ncbi:MAG TPA: hypothetical protein VGP07_20835 [Polyangia bacterium]|jgi:hypothetical protein
MKRLRRVLLTTVAVATLVLATAPLWFGGARFAWLVERLLPPTRGQLHVGGGSWSWGSLWAFARGRPAPLALEQVSIIDPDGTPVFRANRLTASIEVLHGPEGVVVHELHVEGGVWRMARTKDRSGIGFLQAFDPPRHSPSAAKPAASGGGLRIFRLDDVRLEGLDVTFDLPGWALTLRDVHTHGRLAFEKAAAGPPAFTFEATDTDARGGGQISVLAGVWRAVLPFSAVRIARVATMTAAPDALELDAPTIISGRSTTTFRGTFTGIFAVAGPPKPAGLAVTVAIGNAADALQAAVALRGWAPRLTVAGADAALTLTISGPLASPAVDATVRGFDVRYGTLVDARAFGFHLVSRPTTRQASLEGLTLTSPAGGALRIDARLDHLRARGTLTLEHFGTRPYLPAPLREMAAGALHGRVQGHVDLGARTAGLDEVDLAFTRPPGVVGPSVVHVLTTATKAPPAVPGELVLRLGTAHLARGTLDLPRVTAAVAGGRVTVGGSLNLWDATRRDWIPSPSFDLTLESSQLAFERLLGSSASVVAGSGTLSLRAHAVGTFDDIALQAQLAPHQRLRLLGDWFALPSRLALTMAAGQVTLAPLELKGESGGTLDARGTIALTGQLALTVGATKLPLQGLVAWAANVPAGHVPVEGLVSSHLELAGDSGAPTLSGTLSLADMRFQGRPLGGGTLGITTGPRGALRVHGQAIEGMTLDGVVQPVAASGPRVVVTMNLAHLRLDPFVALLPLPGGAAATGLLSGVVTSRLTPGRSPAFEARLSELSLSVTAGRRTGSPAIDLHAERAVHLVAPAGIESLHLDPTRQTGTAGAFDLSTETHGRSVTGRAHGHLNLDVLLPLLPATVEDLAGALAVELSADPRGVTGDLSIVSPVRARFAALPFDVRLPTGHLSFADDVVTMEKLSVALGRETIAVSGRVTGIGERSPRLALVARGTLDPRLAEPLAQGYVRDVDGRLPISASLEGALARPTLRARLGLGGVAFTLMPGANRIRVAGGQLDLDGETLTLHAVDLRVGDGNQLVVGGDGTPGRLRLRSDGAAAPVAMPWTDVDLPARGRVRALATPVAIVDDAAFAVRLSGGPRTLRLAGELFIEAAHVPPELRHPKLSSAGTAGKKMPLDLGATQLDLHIRSQPRAVTVEIGHAPDLHAGLDYHLGGTIAAPKVSGALRPAGVYSSLAFLLARLLQ